MPYENCWLQEAAERIRTGKYRILSLDIFDTTVWRTYPTPVDLFLTLGGQVAAHGWIRSSSLAESFAAARADSEVRARQRKGWTSEVTLEEIYDCMPAGYLRNCSRADVAGLELEIERAATYVNLEVAELIREARQRGVTIAFVSDTYLPECHLRAILPEAPDYLIASCAFGIAKCQGLHQALLDLAAVPARKVLHIGDNLAADVEAPEKLGINTLWFPKFPPGFEESVNSELPVPHSERAHYFQAGGDLGLTSLRSMALNANGNLLDVCRAWGAHVLGPAMAGFCEWILDRCDRESIQSALFLMREGRILRQMIHRIRPGFSAHEFFISRYAAVSAGILSGTTEELTKFLARPSPIPAGRLLRDLLIEPSDVGLRDDSVVADTGAHNLAAAIAGDARLKSKAVSASREVRRRLLAHLTAVLPEARGRVAVVDLGYAGTIQHSLERILAHEELPIVTHGLYFVTDDRIRKVHELGAAAEGYLADRDQPISVSHSFIRCPELFEQSLMCDCGSTVGYQASGEPVTSTIHVPAEQMEAIQRVQAGALDFFDVWTAYRPKLKPDPDAIKPFVTASVVRALTSPSPAELEVFGNWVHDENFNSAETRTLVGCPLPEIYLKHASAHQLASLRSRDAYWVFGLACRLSPTLGKAVKAIYLRKVPPEAFDSSLPPALLRVSWNGASDHQDTATLRLSQNGTCWARFTLPPASESVARLGLAVAPHPATFQFNGAIARPLDKPHPGCAKPCELKDREGRTVGCTVPLAPNEEYFLELADRQPREKDFGLQLDIFLAAHLRA